MLLPQHAHPCEHTQAHTRAHAQPQTLARAHSGMCTLAHTHTPGANIPPCRTRLGWGDGAGPGKPEEAAPHPCSVPRPLGTGIGFSRVSWSLGRKKPASPLRPSREPEHPNSVQHGRCPLEGSVGRGTGPAQSSLWNRTRLERWGAPVPVTLPSEPSPAPCDLLVHSAHPSRDPEPCWTQLLGLLLTVS